MYFACFYASQVLDRMGKLALPAQKTWRGVGYAVPVAFGILSGCCLFSAPLLYTNLTGFETAR